MHRTSAEEERVREARRGDWAIGHKVKVYWVTMDEYYTGVVRYNRRMNEYQVHYSDGEKHWEYFEDLIFLDFPEAQRCKTKKELAKSSPTGKVKQERTPTSKKKVEKKTPEKTKHKEKGAEDNKSIKEVSEGVQKTPRESLSREGNVDKGATESRKRKRVEEETASEKETEKEEADAKNDSRKGGERDEGEPELATPTKRGRGTPLKRQKTGTQKPAVIAEEEPHAPDFFKQESEINFHEVGRQAVEEAGMIDMEMQQDKVEEQKENREAEQSGAVRFFGLTISLPKIFSWITGTGSASND